MKNLVVGSFLAAVAMFFLGAAFWMNPIPQTIIHPAKNEDALAQSLLDHLPKSGVYVLPAQSADQASRDAKVLKGPVAMIHVLREGGPAMGPAMIRGFLIGWVSTALLAFALRLASPSLASYASRVLFSALMGITVAIASDASATVWWYHTGDWAFLNGAYHVLSFLVAGLVLAKFIKPEAPSA